MSASPESCVSAGDPEFPEGALSYNVRILSAQALLDSHRNSQLKLKVILVLLGSVHSPSPCCDITSRPHTSFLSTFHFASGWAALSPGPVPAQWTHGRGRRWPQEVWGSSYGCWRCENHKRERDRKKSFPVRMKSEREKLSEKTWVKEKPNVGFHERNTAQWVVK